MPPQTGKLTIHMVSSLDGFIASKDNSVSWFETSDYYDKGVELSEEMARNFQESVDCYIMGARTYEHALELSKSYGWVYGDVPTIVVTHRNLPVDKPNIEFFSGDLNELINGRVKPGFKNSWLVGGANLTNEILRLKLADELNLSVLPVILGGGKGLFEQTGREQALHLQGVTAYKSGMVEMRYEIK
jgi:dihydrofolate reductase